MNDDKIEDLISKDMRKAFESRILEATDEELKSYIYNCFSDLIELSFLMADDIIKIDTLIDTRRTFIKHKLKKELFPIIQIIGKDKFKELALSSNIVDSNDLKLNQLLEQIINTIMNVYDK